MSLPATAASDMDARPVRHAGRRWLDTVMGAKDLIAIISDGGGTKKIEVKNPDI